MYPFSSNVQRGIIYLLKNDHDFFSQIAPLVSPEYFEYPAHARIYEAVVSHYDEYLSIPTDDFIIEDIRKELGDNGKISDYVEELEDINAINPESIENKEYVLDLVEDFAKKEALKGAIKDSIIHLKNENYGAIENNIREALTVSRQVDIGQNYFSDISDRFRRLYEVSDKERDMFKTMIPTLNSAVEGGLQRKEIGMVVAPPGVGKSLFLANQCVQSLMENRKVLYISLEMSEDRVAQRLDSIASLISQRKMKSDPTSLVKVKERLNLFKEKFSNGDLVIKELPCGSTSVHGIRALLSILRNHERFEPDVIIVDYIGLLRSNDKGMAKYEAMEQTVSEMRGMAQEHNCVVWTATQTNRQGRNVRLITDSELGDSYGQIRPVDLAVSLNQSREEYDEGMMRLYAMKVRNGRAFFTVPLNINYSTLRIEEGEQDDAEEEM
jgi:replicative DNA helicase